MEDFFDEEMELNVVKRDVGTVQQMYFLDNNGNHSRGNDRHGYFDDEGALEQLYENFNFENGKYYMIKYLTNDGKPWKSGKAFQFENGTNLRNHAYNSVEMYGAQDIDIHIYAIVVEEL